MTDALETSRLRLDCARDHLAFLDTEVTTFLENVDRRLVGHFDPETSEYVFHVAGKAPPLDWGIAVSGLLHHTRAALDNLIWALIKQRGGTPREGVSAFPILDEEADWEPRKDGGRGEGRRIAGVSVEDRAIIESVQPYKFRVHDPTSYPADNDSMVRFHSLHQLRELNNADKHRFLHPALVAPSTAQPIREDGVIFAFTPIRDVGAIDGFKFRYVWGVASDDRTEVARLPITPIGPDPEVKMETDIDLVVSLSNGDPFVDFATLRDIIIYAEEQVIERLAPGFA